MDNKWDLTEYQYVTNKDDFDKAKALAVDIVAMLHKEAGDSVSVALQATELANNSLKIEAINAAKEVNQNAQ